MTLKIARSDFSLAKVVTIQIQATNYTQPQQVFEMYRQLSGRSDPVAATELIPCHRWLGRERPGKTSVGEKAKRLSTVPKKGRQKASKDPQEGPQKAKLKDRLKKAGQSLGTEGGVRLVPTVPRLGSAGRPTVTQATPGDGQAGVLCPLSPISPPSPSLFAAAGQAVSSS